MSVEAITWALSQPISQSSAKFVLVVMANCASAEGDLAFPSTQYLAEATGQDRKTVLTNLQKLRDAGLIEDTGKRTGATKQIVIYRLNRSGNGTVKEPQNGNSTENGTVPKTDGNSPVFPTKQSRFSAKQSQKRDTEPSEPSSNRKSKHKPLPLDLSSWPSQPKPEILADWLAMRKRRRADVSDTVVAAMAQQLRIAGDVGWSVDECLAECVLRNWQGLKASWLEPRNKSTAGGQHAATSGSRTASHKLSAVERVEAAIAERRAREQAGGDIIDGTFTTIDP